MWDLYDDDESFQRLARGRGFHDANLLAKVLYGKNALVKEKEIEENNNSKSKSKNVKFRKEEGKFTIDSELQDPSECTDEFDYLWRSQDWTTALREGFIYKTSIHFQNVHEEKILSCPSIYRGFLNKNLPKSH